MPSNSPSTSVQLGLVLDLSSGAVVAGEIIEILPTYRDETGEMANSLPAILYEVSFDASDADGTLPVVTNGNITTFADTRGVYTLEGTVDGTSFSVSIDFFVFFPSGDNDQYSILTTSVNGIAQQLGVLQEATEVATLQKALDEFRYYRSIVDLIETRRSAIFAPEKGFLPSPHLLAANGFAATPDDTTLQSLMGCFIQNTQTFSIALNSGISIESLQVLNNNLHALVEQFLALDPTVWVGVGSRENQLSLRQCHPDFLHDIVNTLESAIVADNIGVTTHLRSVSNQKTSSLENRYSIGHRRTFLLAELTAGFTTAVAWRMNQFKRISYPVMHDLYRSVAVMAIADLLREYFNAVELDGIITGGSIFLHFWGASSEIEVQNTNPTYPGRSSVFLVGTNAIATVEGLLISFNPGEIESLEDAYEYIKGVVEARQDFGQDIDDMYQVADSVGGTCILLGGPNCVKLNYDTGFKSVNAECLGFLCVPQPVLTLVHNHDTGGWAFGENLFNP